MKEHHYILSIAGFDPSGGAGIMADVQTFQAHGLYGLAVCTAITVQNDIEFKSCEWIEEQLVLDQIEMLFKRFKIKVIKIGIVPHWKRLLRIIEKLRAYDAELTIVVDPVLKASAGFDFHSKDEMGILDKVLEKIDLITPNDEEVQLLFPSKSVQDTLAFMQERTAVYHKGGHRKDKRGWDVLYMHQGDTLEIPPEAATIYEKHGSGCVLSAALASQLALGNAMEKAGILAKAYTEAFLNSHTGHLGTHATIAPETLTTYCTDKKEA
ncbi:hydroxymethylpyrimidine/phosphomethylpyrimidine kinase [Spongiimicrobium salis]|uniref:hydroxymethylpyrimidine/phosphomethylpyrimidine kinase n=1 Tax=Spongiimicrobium salis TaxID=1667022 RepID=UPI00374CA86C